MQVLLILIEEKHWENCTNNRKESKMKNVIFAFFIFILVHICYAEETNIDIIFLKDRSESLKLLMQDQTPIYNNRPSGYKNPDTAFLLSFIPPIIVPVQGLGQFYIGKNDEGLFYLAAGIICMSAVYKYIKEGRWDYKYDSHGNEISAETNNNGLYAVLGAVWYVGQWIYSSQKARDDAEKINKSLNISYNNKGTSGLTLSYSF